MQKALSIVKWILTICAVGLAVYITGVTDPELARTLLWTEIALCVILAVLFSLTKEKRKR